MDLSHTDKEKIIQETEAIAQQQQQMAQQKMQMEAQANQLKYGRTALDEEEQISTIRKNQTEALNNLKETNNVV